MNASLIVTICYNAGCSKHSAAAKAARAVAWNRTLEEELRDPGSEVQRTRAAEGLHPRPVKAEWAQRSGPALVGKGV